jgi:polyhydroxybutyrate depolymerase
MHFQTDWPEALVIYMQGLPTPGLLGDIEGKHPGWQQTPGQLEDRDLKFFDTVLAAIKEKYPVDDRRIYATGFSNGGFFTFFVVVTASQSFCRFRDGACTILPAVHITEPRRVSLVAKVTCWRCSPTRKAIEELRKLNGCSEKGDRVETDARSIHRRTPVVRLSEGHRTSGGFGIDRECKRRSR